MYNKHLDGVRENLLSLESHCLTMATIISFSAHEIVTIKLSRVWSEFNKLSNKLDQMEDRIAFYQDLETIDLAAVKKFEELLAEKPSSEATARSVAPRDK